MKQLLSLLGTVLLYIPGMAQTSSVGTSLQPQWGDGSAPISIGKHKWQVKNDSGQTWYLHGISFYTDTGNSQLTSVMDDAGNQLLSAATPITGSNKYATGALIPGASVGYGHGLILEATFDGVTTRGQADIAVVHAPVDGSESGGFSNWGLTAATYVGGKSIQYGNPQSVSVPNVPAGSASFVAIAYLGVATPTVTDNGAVMTEVNPYSQTGYSVRMFMSVNATAGTHTYQASYANTDSNFNYQFITAFVASGASTRSPLDGQVTWSSPSATVSNDSITCPAATPTTAGEMVAIFGTGGDHPWQGQNMTVPTDYPTPQTPLFAYGYANGTSTLVPSFISMSGNLSYVCGTFLVH